jgi:hypothetical protein
MGVAQQALREVTWLIQTSNVSAVVTRPGVTGAGTFDGPIESSVSTVGTVAIEMNTKVNADLTAIGADASASVLPSCGILENDWVTVSGIRYKVTNIQSQNFFGVVTHWVLILTKDQKI